MVISDTIPFDDEKKARTTKVKAISISSMLAKTILAIQGHAPVSQVYEEYHFDMFK